MTDEYGNETTLGDLTVIVVSDYEAGEKTWRHEISMLRALAAQDLGRPFRVIVAEDGALQGNTPPREVFEAVADVEIVYGPSASSAELKDFAVGKCRTPWTAVLEADALPARDWLKLLTEAAAANPGFAAYSGRTWYGGETAWRRALSLIGRSFDDRGNSGETEHVSNNGALYRTEVLEKFPYPHAATPFLSARLRLRRMGEAGLRFYFRRDAVMRHAVGGFGFVFDVHRNAGFSDMMMAVERRACLMPGLSWRRMRTDAGAALRVGRRYLKLFDWPLWAFLFVLVRIPEWRGMGEALRNPERLEGSAYR